MMRPVSTPAILTDTIFANYNGVMGTSSVLQRNAAYCIAEQFAEEQLGTYLTGTVVTGTFLWPDDGTLMVPETHLQAVLGVTALHDDGCDCVATELSGCAYVLSYDGGTISVRQCTTSAAVCCTCSCACRGHPYQVRVAYRAGLPSTASEAPVLRMALVLGAQLALDEMLSPYKLEGGAGDPGVQTWADANYREERTRLWRTAFGTSAIANHIAKLLSPFRYNRCLRM